MHNAKTRKRILLAHSTLLYLVPLAQAHGRCSTVGQKYQRTDGAVESGESAMLLRSQPGASG